MTTGSVVLADVVDDLVEGALQERGVERHEGPLAAQGEARRERHGVLLGDADVEDPSGKRRRRWPRPVPVGMPAVMATTRVVLRPMRDQLGGHDRV